MAKITAETLSRIEVFRNLAASERRALAADCRARYYSINEPIVSRQDDPGEVFFVVSGRVRVTIFSRSGRQVSFRDLGAGQMFGDLSAIDGGPRSATVVALEDSLIASMPPERFWQALRAHPAVVEATLKDLVSLVRRLSDRVIEFSTLGVKNRIHAELLRLAREHMQGNNTAEVSPTPTHAEIASRISTHREAVTRELNHLAQTGLIERRSAKLIIHDVARLARLVQDMQEA